MSHARLRDQLGEYLEGDLDVARRALLEEHLRACPGCREELDGLRGTVALLRGLPDPVPPPDLGARVVARVRTEAGAPLLGAFRGAGLARATGALAAVLAGVLLMASWRERPPGPASAPATEAPRTASAPAAPRAVSVWSGPGVPAPRPLRVRRGGVAPVTGHAGPGASGRAGELEFDRQLDLLLGDPGAFQARMGPHARDHQLAQLAQHAARRGRAASLASRLIPVPHPVADQLVPRLLAASFDAETPGR